MIKSMNIAWWVKRWSELHPQKTAIIFEGDQISYLKLHQKVNRVSGWIQSLGIEKGDRVAVMLSNCPEFLELFLACSNVGAIFVPINYRLAAAELNYTLENSRPRLFVFGDEFADAVSSLKLNNRRPLMRLAGIPASALPNNIANYLRETADHEGQLPFDNDLNAPAAPEEAHVIMYTSGTTGQPKGAVLSHRKTFFTGAYGPV